ncbi:hypothetical protein C8J55DRAFT_557331 [Lentinula edodes]|uniref:Uncharacterized protein n=1 Tax=Lentinula lateritia TaxID=40482 RepID=A0A9W9AUF9_9AGAR|nr:hypothetical protein C8J55DRAFT_557331 [Lentinula edodes]
MVFFPRYLLARLLALCVVLHVAVAIPVVHTSAGTLERRKPTQAILDEYQMLQIRILYFRLDEDEKKSDSVNPDLLGQYDKMWLCIGHNCFRGEKSRSSGLLPQEKIATEKDLGPALQIGVVSFLSLNQKDEILKSFGTKVIKEKKNNLSYVQGMIADLRASWRKGMTLGLDKRPPYTTHASQ